MNHNRAAMPFMGAGGRSASDDILKSISGISMPKWSPSNSPKVARHNQYNNHHLQQQNQNQGPQMGYPHKSPPQQQRNVPVLQEPQVSYQQVNERPQPQAQPQQQRQPPTQPMTSPPAQPRQNQMDHLTTRTRQMQISQTSEMSTTSSSQVHTQHEQHVQHQAHHHFQQNSGASVNSSANFLASPAPSSTNSQGQGQKDRSVKFSDENSYHNYTNIYQPAANSKPNPLPTVAKPVPPTSGKSRPYPHGSKSAPDSASMKSQAMSQAVGRKPVGAAAVSLASSLKTAADRIDKYSKPQFLMSLTNRDCEVHEPAVFEVRVDHAYNTQVDSVQWYFNNIPIRESLERDIRILALSKNSHTVFTLVIGEFLEAYEGNYEVQLANTNGKSVSKCYCRAVPRGTLEKGQPMVQHAPAPGNVQHYSNKAPAAAQPQAAYSYQQPQPQQPPRQQYTAPQPSYNQASKPHANVHGAKTTTTYGNSPLSQLSNPNKMWTPQTSNVMQALNNNGAAEARSMPRMGKTQSALQQFI